MKDYQRITKKDENGKVFINEVDMGDLYSGLSGAEQMQVEIALDRLAELEDQIEDGKLVFIRKPFYSKICDCWVTYNRFADYITTSLMTEQQAKEYAKKRKGER